jgi:hypothetical protein
VNRTPDADVFDGTAVTTSVGWPPAAVGEAVAVLGAPALGGAGDPVEAVRDGPVAMSVEVLREDPLDHLCRDRLGIEDPQPEALERLGILRDHSCDATPLPSHVSDRPGRGRDSQEHCREVRGQLNTHRAMFGDLAM